MIDFIEYVVAELKNKRLSKTDAVALVRQFSRQSSGGATAPRIHPLLHRNISDLVEQRFGTTFTGEEFFLTDHQVTANGGAARKVLPGVAYLEMARAALEQALPGRPESSVLELRNTVWAQPVVVSGSKEVSIALAANDDDEVEFEVYSRNAGQETVHCQGRAMWSAAPAPATLDLTQLELAMGEGQLDPETLYATCARMGLAYGPSFRGITALHRGSGQVLAQLRLPAAAGDTSADYVLHPALMDGALQAAVGLTDGAESGQARLPFALETLRIMAACTTGMYAWLRYSPGSQATDKVVKLDIDLCDDRGNVCVEMRGFSWRVLSSELSVAPPQTRSGESLLAVPVWQTSGDEISASVDFTEQHTIVYLQPDGQKNAAERFSDCAVECFARIQGILAAKPNGKVLVRIVVGDGEEQQLLTGLSGLLKTAALENPQIVGQLIVVPAGITAEELNRTLEAETRRGLDPVVRYQQGTRQVLRWEEVAAETEKPSIAFRHHGVYLITGGFGAIGLLFAREILRQTRDARVILTGRSPLTAEKRAQLSDGMTYRQLNLGNRDEVRQLIAAIREEHGRLDGILHAAGMIADQFILRKDETEFREVLAPKVGGTYNLDQASRDVDLDFFVLFSAAAGAMGNPGQADYATANAFMDAFAAYRNRLVAAQQRHGRTRSIDWPLWQDGGMAVDAASKEWLRRTTGMQAMQTATGLDAFYRSLAFACDQMLVVEGDLPQIRSALLGAGKPTEETPVAAPVLDAQSLAEKTQHYLRREFSELLKLPAQKIDPRAALENYGIDSILAMQLTNRLETTFGSLPKTLFFEYQTIRELADYFIANYAAQLTELLTPATTRPAAVVVPAGQTVTAAPAELLPSRRNSRRRSATVSAPKEDDPIAIIGLSGRYPQAVDVEAYWENLRAGKDCITEVPKERWDWREYFTEDRGKRGHHYSKWGGFIEGVDEFDPLFFNISPVDAEQIDPQERLFLQHAWMAMEDAGYTRAALHTPSDNDLPGQVGVYVGVMYTEYQLFGSKRQGIIGSFASVANRVSYALNLHGPSMTLDSMCSSSLTAIHVACEDLRHGRTSMAIAGGVNVTIHPNKYLILSDGQFISGDGHCQSFGEGGDGYIPGEGVGAVILKRLSDAQRDGDHIYGVIRGSALNHGGKTNGYSVPNPQAQATAIGRALAEARIDARHISYIEAHGTGTKLGDPIEIAALNRTFQKYTEETGFCRIGSAKSNVGHCESAAGIAGLTKVLLQMQHRQIVPSLHSSQLNPHIDFGKTPFVVNQELRPWERPVVDGRTLPRIAGISSFGAGGSNAHMIVEEYEAPAAQAVALPSVVIVLSARTAAQLQQQARKLVDFVRPRLSTVDLVSMAWTLQTGREAMEERLGVIVSSAEELVEKLEAWLAGKTAVDELYLGQAKRNNETLSLFSTDAELQGAVDRWIAGQKLARLVELWVKGLELDWRELYVPAKPRRMSLPTYPFARERYWIDVTAAADATANGSAVAVLHPLLHSNTSDLNEQRYRSTFTGDEFFLADHQVEGTGKVLPGVAYLEMARAAIERALPARAEATVLELRNVVWAQPVIVTGTTDVSIALFASDDDGIDFEIFTDEEIVHSQGRALFSEAAPAKLDLGQLSAELALGHSGPEGVYAACARMGLLYGPSFRGITAIRRGNGQLLAQLRLPEVVAGNAEQFVLHPSLMDSSLQAAVALLDGAEPGQPRVPFALETLRIVAPCTTEMVAWVRLAAGSQATDSVVKLDIDLCDASGNVCVQMHGISSRVMAREIGALLVAPVWERADAAGTTTEFAERHILLLEPTDPRATIAQRYSDAAVVAFEQIQTILRSKLQGRALVQIVVPDDGEQALLAGLSGLLKTAALENPRFTGQLVLVPAGTTADELAARLKSEGALDAVVRYEAGERQILRWQEVPAGAEKAPFAFREDGVYLITGGMGGLGTLFAKEILERAPRARVVLTGRSALSSQPRARLDALSAEMSRISYRQVDLTDLEQVKRLIAGVQYEYGQLNGILHSAGMLADSFLLKKTARELRDVLAPKVTGAYHLDQATRILDLDFFVLFSSLAGALGSVGQGDYAAANGFLDQFAAYRNRQVAAGERRGRTVSINWPLWQDGGMAIDAAREELLLQTTGMRPMLTATGIDAFGRALASPHDQILVAEGDVTQLRRALVAAPAARVAPQAVPVAGNLAEKTQEYLRQELAALLKLPAHRIDPQAALEEYGIDSILAMKLTAQLEKTFGSLPKTLFFEYQTIHALAGYFAGNHAAQLAAMLTPSAEAAPVTAQAVAATAAPAKLVSSRRLNRTRAASSAIDDDPIAIIGLSGRYPEALDLEQYWENLRDGKDCITEVPAARWNWREYFSEDRSRSGHHFSKWGGFIEGVDEFDPLFFNISPADAERIDPQERLFLQYAWMAMEDAGYSRASLQIPSENDLPGQVGVYAGVMFNEYQLFGAEAAARGKRMGVPGSTASIANRVSYALNLHGPSLTLDTMCSSSLTAIHFACQDLKLGRTSLAIAGGVNVTVHPNKYLVLSEGQFISSDGHCQSFGEGGDGYIPGEGVGVVVLKRLSEAKRDGDHIYGIIRGSALNHGGKTNGYTVPNPQAQAGVIRRALAESRIDARHISYIEAHGTGTTLGDPIEIAALSKAFHGSTEETGFCRIGSVKSNVGHCESAAGIAGITKVVLQMQHRQIVPSLHSARLNPHIDFARTPFVVNQSLTPWERPVIDGRTLPRIAGISSFGAGGSNAHILIEEYQQPAVATSAPGPVAIVLSARTSEQLQQKVRDLLAFVETRSIDIADVAYTLQVGREPLEERLGFVVTTPEELVAKLGAYLRGEHDDLYRGQVRRTSETLSLFSADADLQETVDKWLANRKLAKLVDLWVRGLEVDWSKLHGAAKPRRVSLPAYPFARERYWIDITTVAAQGTATAVLHPLLHSNTSDLSEQRYRSTFTGSEFFLADHQVGANRILPGVAHLEMARAAVEEAAPRESGTLELRNVVWAQPIVVAAPAQVQIALSPNGEGIDYEIFSDEIVHGQGLAVWSSEPAPARLDLEQLAARMNGDAWQPDGLYAAFSRMGLEYGPSFQGITTIQRGTGELLAQLRLPKTVEQTSSDYVLHPSLMDSAVQAAAGLVDSLSELTGEPRVPFGLESVRIVAPCTRAMTAWVRLAQGSSAADPVVRIDVDLCDESGNVCVQLRGLSSRVMSLAPRQTDGTLLAAPFWQAGALAATRFDYAEHHVLSTEGTSYSDAAAMCFERIQSLLRSGATGKVLLQVVATDPRFAGLASMLKTATLENPRFTGQLLVARAGITAEQLENEKLHGADTLVRYEGGVRQVVRWQEVAAPPEAIAFRPDGLYLVTGGFGGLGLLFAKEIVAQGARVVLTGRSPISAEKQAILDGLAGATYRQLDLNDLGEVRQLIASLTAEHGKLNGILHSAGMTADRFIVQKSAAELRAVLEPKVTGTLHLDEATRDVELDFFVLFSSIASMGNAGQADYAAANGFLDHFAADRNRQVAAHERHGRTRSINWPLWQDGGMSLDAGTLAVVQQTTGMRPMRTATGIEAFRQSLALPHDQLLVVEGNLAQIRRTLLAEPASAGQRPAVIETATEGLAEKTQDFLRQEFSPLLKLPAQKIDPQAALENYGIDSILAMKLTTQLEKTFGSLSKTLFFEYQTVAALAAYFVKTHGEVVREKVGAVATESPKAVAAPAATPGRRSKARFAQTTANDRTEIAIVGLAGRYPQAENLAEFWRNLQNGRDSITEIPSERWDHKLYFDSDANKVGKSYSKWGGFIDDVDKFDPLFFNISPKEAALLDPQERLFLQTAWQTIEDAGYTRESISGGRVGVFVGVMWGQYELFGAESVLRGGSSLPGSSHGSIANRVSYFFDFHGPSIALDTMCSSSLTAIHLACEELRRGEIDAAIAGGVNVTVHPYKYLSLSQGKFASSDGRCRSFGAGGDGYVPGEGVGAVLLKPLAHALRDGDQIYAVIKSTSVNHGGKTNGYTVPNPNAQGELILSALKKADIDPKTLSYIETHGTGTSLGDPIEIAGLLKAFEGATDEKQFCAIGSVKSNIGHLESAAGIAAVTKALLQIRHQQLVPSLHAEPLNPNIRFEDSPFYVQTELADWKRTSAHPRRVGVSSFGAGGSNAHLILEEYVDPRQPQSASQPEIFVLSAKSADALRRYAERTAQFLGEVTDLSLASVAYTSQVGRTAMDARLAIIGSSVDDLRARLNEWLAGAETGGFFSGSVREAGESAGSLVSGAAGNAFIGALLASHDLEKIARLWVLGADVDWSLLERHETPRRVSLPTYPFAKERCWIDQHAPALRRIEAPEQPVEPKRRTYYAPQWTTAPLTGKLSSIGPILVLDSSDALFQDIQQHAADPVVLVKPGQSDEQFQQLVSDLASKSLLPSVVLHHAADACDLDDEQQVAQRLNDGLYSLVALSKALMRVKHQTRIVSVSSGSPLDAAIAGFFKTVSLEEPGYLTRTVDIGDGSILDELYGDDWSAQEVRYRGGVRQARLLAETTPRSQSPLPLRQNGIYVITGGMGGLGAIFAESLAKNYRAKLVLIGRSAPSAAQEETLARLRGYGAEVLVLQADVRRVGDVETAVQQAKARFGRIDGVIHAAGVNRDALLLRKSREEMDAVLAPKVFGTINLDRATRGENLDFFVLFSSVAGVLGNVGQSDYAFGNRFLDAFAETRSGRTLSIDWPLWQEGGMTVPQDQIALLEQETGICPLPTDEGLRYWEELLRSDAVQSVALYGVASKIAGFIARPTVKVQRTAPQARPQVSDSAALVAKTEEYLKARVGEEIKLAPERIGSSDPLESFGIDSVMINHLNAQLESDLGALPKTLFYENETVHELATYLVREAREALVARFGAGEPEAVVAAAVVAAAVEVEESVVILPARKEDDELEAIAIIGVHGYYPRSADLAQYWDNLKEGRDLTGVVPADRWDAEELYHPDPAAAADGKIYAKWGAFLDNHDQFDPHFFKISTAEAKVIDPQERLFLQSVWSAIEDAGYTRESLRTRFAKTGSADVGVFVGVTTNTYNLWAPEERSRGNFVSPTAMPWSIANRVSYFFDFNGPSLPVDTACSSSLVAIHLASESLRNGECQVAIAGGVNLYLHPSKYHSLCQRRMLSRDGKCHSYGAGDDGFVPGEGVGTVILKPLRRAVADGDRIYAVVRASAFDHSGRSNGYSAPNPNAQANLIRRTLEKAHIHPETIGYVEGHGTGTQLGDSIEIAALSKAFQKETSKKQFCPIGSVKANLGHSESAAGVAGLAKVLLQIEHRQLAPTIHSDRPNPNIELEDSPFYLQHGLSEWPRPAGHPRRALINSFGAGGVNACLVVEEYEAPLSPSAPQAGPSLFILSARNEDRLRDSVDLLLGRLHAEPAIDLESLCYTLQVGREAMEERLAMVVSSVAELTGRLADWKERGLAANVLRGSLDPRRGSKRAKAKTSIGGQTLGELAARWIVGEEVQWESLYGGKAPRRIALPTYPFAQERYWISDDAPVVAKPLPSVETPTPATLHPLIGYNASTLKEVRFSSTLSESAFYAVDHKVDGEPIFPGAGFLEMACISASIGGEDRVRRITDIIWMQPLSFRHGAQNVRTVLRQSGDVVEYAVSSFDDDNEPIVHSEGRLGFWNGSAKLALAERVSIDALKAQCATREEGAACYVRFNAYGLQYGPSFQTIRELHVNDSLALAKLTIPEHLKADFGQFLLHPSLIDGALQTVAGLAGIVAPQTPCLPFALDEIEIHGPLPQACYALAEWSGVRPQNPAGVMKFTVRLFNENGDVLVRLRNLYVRPFAKSLTTSDPQTSGKLLRLSGEVAG